MFPRRNMCMKWTSMYTSRFTVHGFRRAAPLNFSSGVRRVSSRCFTLISDLQFRERPLLVGEVQQRMESLMYLNSRLMAGHSKWQNIKHTKVAKDKEKSKLCDRYARLARFAVRQNGPDPKLNSTLRNILEEARKHSVPFSTIENAIKKVSSGKIKSGIIEILGPGGCFFIIDYETENVSTMRHGIKQVLRKFGSNIMQGEGKWRAAFEKKGIIIVGEQKEGEGLNPEKALDSAIEAGAENVQLKVDDDDNRQYLEFLCDPNDIHSVKKELENMQYKVEEAYIGFIPHVTVQLEAEDMSAAGNLLSELEDMNDVIRVFENVQQ